MVDVDVDAAKFFQKLYMAHLHAAEVESDVPDDWGPFVRVVVFEQRAYTLPNLGSDGGVPTFDTGYTGVPEIEVDMTKLGKALDLDEIWESAWSDWEDGSYAASLVSDGSLDPEAPLEGDKSLEMFIDCLYAKLVEAVDDVLESWASDALDVADGDEGRLALALEAYNGLWSSSPKLHQLADELQHVVDRVLCQSLEDFALEWATEQWPEVPVAFLDLAAIVASFEADGAMDLSEGCYLP